MDHVRSIAPSLSRLAKPATILLFSCFALSAGAQDLADGSVAPGGADTQEIVHHSPERALALPPEARLADIADDLTLDMSRDSELKARVVSEGIYPPIESAASSSPQTKVDLLGLEHVIAAESLDERRPNLAYNSNSGEYLLVYERVSTGPTSADIYGQLLNEEGRPIGSPFAIMAEPGDESDPQVAYSSVGLCGTA